MVSAPMPNAWGGLLAEAVRQFRAGRAHLRVSVLELRDEQQAEALAGGRLHAVLTCCQPTVDGLVAEVLVQGHPRADGELLPLVAERLLFGQEDRVGGQSDRAAVGRVCCARAAFRRVDAP
jgi:hypothetical protein